MTDLDIGEMFLNFILEASCAQLVWVDLTKYLLKGRPSTKRQLMIWGRCFMGATSSSYQTGQGLGHANKLILGDPTDSQNVFRLERVRIKLPGALGYEPKISWVSTVREDGCVTADSFIYMDGLWPTAPSEKECWQDQGKTGSTCNYLGIQDASRKRRGCSRKPGSWA
jgi:hypothetical protein